MADNKVSDPQKLAKANYQAYIRLRDHGHSEWVEQAQRQTDFYLGNQWSASDLKTLEEEGRPALTMNTILSTVNTLIGEMVQNQADVHYKPLRGGTEETAHYLNAIYQHVTDLNGYRYIEQMLFADGIIEDRGFLDVRIDFDSNVLGEISIRLEDGTQVLIDNQARDRDPDTWSEVIVTRWLTLDEVEVQYGPEKREALELSAAAGYTHPDDSIEFVHDRRFGDETGYSVQYDDDTRTVNRVRVIERQWRKLTKVHCFVDPVTGDIREIPSHWEPERIQAVMEQYGFYETEITKRRVRITVSADTVLLADDWSPYRSFTIIPFFPYFRRGKPVGAVRNLMSPQELLNKTTSQELHIVNSTANSGWILEENSLSNMTEDELVENGSKTGLVLVVRRGATIPPQKIQPNSMPVGIDRISMKASGSIREISGVNAAMAGAVSTHQISGVAIREQTQRGQIQAIVPDEALKWTRHKLALKILELVQDFYTEGRIIYVADPLDPMDRNKEVYINAMDEQGNVPNDVTVGRYDVAIGTIPSRDTMNEIEFAQLMQLREVGVQVPDHVIIQKSNLTNREQLAKFVMDLQGFGEMTPEQQQQLEEQQELQMRATLAEIAGLEAKASELQTRAAANQAKAESMQGYNQAAIELAKIESDIEKKREELMLRARLAQLSYGGQMVQNSKNNATKMALAMLQAQTKETESKSQPTPKKEATKR